MNKKFNKLAYLCAAVLALQFPLSAAGLAQDMEGVPSGVSKAVMKYNICRVVVNNSDADILVPLASMGEWSGPESFIMHAPSFPGVAVRACQPGGGSDATMCRTVRFGNAVNYPRSGDICGSMSYRVLSQSSFLPVSSGDGSDWAEAISWASDNLGRPASARPDDILPACYTNSHMNELSRDAGGYVPPGSDFCISARLHSRTWNSSGGPEDGGASIEYFRVWR